MEEKHDQNREQSGMSAKSKTFSADDFVAKFREKLEEAVRKHPVFCKEIAYLDTSNPVRDLAVSLAMLKANNDILEKAGEHNAAGIVQEEVMEMLLAYLTKKEGNLVDEAAQVAVVAFRTACFALAEWGWEVKGFEPSHGAADGGKTTGKGEPIMGKNIKKGCASCAKKATAKKAATKKPAKKSC